MRRTRLYLVMSVTSPTSNRVRKPPTAFPLPSALISPTPRTPERLHEMRADGLVLRELQFAQHGAADVVVRYVCARVIQEGAPIVFAGLRELVKKMTFLNECTDA
jgi:hypothetical protein